MFDFADRVKNLPPYGLARTEPLKAEARAKGLDLIDLTIGSPDLRPPKPRAPRPTPARPGARGEGNRTP